LAQVITPDGLVINQMLLVRTDNRPNEPFADGKAAYVTVHMTGNAAPGANAYRHALWLYNLAEYSWHLTVDDAEIWQSLLETEQGWHAGDGLNGPGNTMSIAVEICMNSDIDQEAAYVLGARLVAYLLSRGHGYKGIVQHNYWTGKDCPQLIRAVPGKWEWFLSKVEEFSDVGMTLEERAKLDRIERLLGGEQKVIDWDIGVAMHNNAGNTLMAGALQQIDAIKSVLGGIKYEVNFRDSYSPAVKELFPPDAVEGQLVILTGDNVLHFARLQQLSIRHSIRGIQISAAATSLRVIGVEDKVAKVEEFTVDLTSLENDIAEVRSLVEGMLGQHPHTADVTIR